MYRSWLMNQKDQDNNCEGVRRETDRYPFEGQVRGKQQLNNLILDFGIKLFERNQKEQMILEESGQQHG